MDIQQMLDELRKPFHPSRVSWKPGAVKGERALAMPYADMRVYMDRLDEVCGGEWSVTYEPWATDRIICWLTIAGVTRCSTGESSAESDRNEIGGTVAEAQSFKRAGAMFGLGRYLYNLPTTWADYDPKARQFTNEAKARLTSMLETHYRRTSGDAPPSTPQAPGSALCEQLNALGEDLYGASWPGVLARNVHRISGGKVEDCAQLTAEQVGKLISGMNKVKSKRAAPQAPAATEDDPFADKSPQGSPAHERFWGQGKSAFGPDWEAARAWIIEKYTKSKTPDNVRTSAADLNDAEKDELADSIKDHLKTYQARWREHKAALAYSSGNGHAVAA